MKKVKDIAIFGAGGFGREVACLLRKINAVEPTWNFVGFYDDGLEKGSRVDYGEILGGIADLNVVDRPLSVVVALGNPKTLQTVTLRRVPQLRCARNLQGLWRHSHRRRCAHHRRRLPFPRLGTYSIPPSRPRRLPRLQPLIKPPNRCRFGSKNSKILPVSYTHLRAHETGVEISYAVFCL